MGMLGSRAKTKKNVRDNFRTTFMELGTLESEFRFWRPVKYVTGVRKSNSDLFLSSCVRCGVLPTRGKFGGMKSSSSEAKRINVC